MTGSRGAEADGPDSVQWIRCLPDASPIGPWRWPASKPIHEWLQDGDGFALGRADWAATDVEGLAVHDRRGREAAFVIEQRLAAADRLTYSRWLETVSLDLREVGERLRESWTGDLRQLVHLVGVLAIRRWATNLDEPTTVAECDHCLTRHRGGMPYPQVENDERPHSVIWIPLTFSGRSPPRCGPTLSAETVATYISWRSAIAVGPTDFSTAESECLHVFDGHAPWPSARIKLRFLLAEDILWGRWVGAAGVVEDVELAEGLRSTWDGDLGALFDLLAALRS